MDRLVIRLEQVIAAAMVFATEDGRQVIQAKVESSHRSYSDHVDAHSGAEAEAAAEATATADILNSVAGV